MIIDIDIDTDINIDIDIYIDIDIDIDMDIDIDIDGSLCPTNAVGVLGLTTTGQLVYDWSEEGPVLGPTGQLQLDPDNTLCGAKRPVFATCKNNCPGGE